MSKTGVFICHCGTNIAGTVDVPRLVREIRAEHPELVVNNTLFLCSKTGQALIKDTISNEYLDRVVVASCSPAHHGNIFNNCVGERLNPFMWDMANIREHCSWVHQDIEEGTRKAKALIMGAVERVKQHQPIGKISVPVVRDVAVIGAGIAGLHTAIEIANKGLHVHLIEKEPNIGGKMVKLDRTFPTDDCSMCTISPILNEVMGNENITLYTLSEVEELKGRPGDYKLKVKRKARYVDETKCTGCGECEKHCFTRFAPQLQNTVDWSHRLIPEEKEETDRIVDHYKAQQMHLISILHDVQKRFNYLPKPILGYVAQRLAVPLSRVYHVATFYTAFSLEPRGKQHIKVCTGTSCHVRGATKVLDEVKSVLGVKEGETTKDGEYSLETVACIGCCALSPCMVVNKEVHAKLTPNKARELFEK